MEDDNKAKENFSKESAEHERAYYEQKQKDFKRELDINLDEAYRQLGKKRPPISLVPPAPSYYSGNVTNAGWNNVDRYVLESTTQRSTLNFTDSETGKKAIIKYEPLQVELNNTEKFDHVFAYLVADSLSSYSGSLQPTTLLFSCDL